MNRFITFLEIEILFWCPLKFMYGYIWWSTKVGAKLLFELVIILLFSSDISLDFNQSVQVVPLKHLMYLLAGINTKWFLNIPEEKYFPPLRIQMLFFKHFVNPFVNITLTFLMVPLIYFHLKQYFLVYHQNLSFLWD